LALQLVGLGSLTVGLLLFAASWRRFATEGKGTLGPWDPPRQLVVRGPYSFVRNPMISGVIFILFGEALVLLSLPQAVWAVSFLVLNLIYIPLLEEPQLEQRFGDSYREYCEHVRRLIPRIQRGKVPTQTTPTSIIGEMKSQPQSIVSMVTGFGGTRIVDVLTGEQLRAFTDSLFVAFHHRGLARIRAGDRFSWPSTTGV
jgi:Phospholipid methyltransferase